MKRRYWSLFHQLAIASLVVAACGPAATTTAPKPTEAGAPATTAPQPTEAPAVTTGTMSGEVTMWHAYGTGSAEEQALTQVIDLVKKNNPDLIVNVLQIPFDQVFNKWQTEVAAGGGPDLYTAPNDSLGDQVRAGLVAPIDDLVAGKLDGFSTLAVDGVTVDGSIYAVPGIVKAVALYYNKSTVPEPPATTDALMKLVKDGKKLVINQNGYHNFGFWSAFGGTLMDSSGKCVADQGGFADAMQYLVDLKAAGALFETDGGKADTLFRQGQADMIINGPWVLGDYGKDLGDNLGVVPIPAGPKGPAQPLSGIDGWYVNPNSANQQLAVDFALAVLGQEGQTIYANVAGAPASRTDVKADNSNVTAFAVAGSAGFPRPQSAAFSNYWGPFGDMITKVMEGKATPADGVAEACAAMNKANGISGSAGAAAGASTMITGLEGEVTMWHAYGTGSAEEQALTQVIDLVKKNNPDLIVNVLQIPFDQVFNKWQTEVAAGGGPDLYTAPNDSLGDQVRAGLVAPIDDLVAGKLDGFSTLAVDGVTVDGSIYAVPGIVKAVALYYNKSTVPEPPATTDALMKLVKDGKKLVINQNGYHNFGFWSAFGGTLMDSSGKCVADQGGFADAMQYLVDLKAAGALFETDGGKADTLFRQGQADMIINGPWVLGDYGKDLGDNLGVVPIPAGPKGPAQPLSGIDGWYVNPNSANQQLAVDFALAVLGQEGQTIYANVAGAPASRTDVKADNSSVTAFAVAGSAGFPRPQSAAFSNYWGPFGDMITKVMEGKATPADGVAEACAAMNKANGK